jgi:hypothetical protein
MPLSGALTCLQAQADERAHRHETGDATSVEPSSMARRPTGVKPILSALVALPLLAACFSAQATQAASDGGGSPLSQVEIAKAEAVARRVIAEQGASVSNATVIERPGKVKDSNTGHPCTSGRELQIKLIGKFPHTVTTGHPVPPGSPTPDFTVRAMIITADAESGLECLIGVQTGENGGPKPLVGGTTLLVG